jgi:hypothetical protein
MTNPQPSSIHQNVNPSEVGWQFVPKYYTFLNQQPNRLHCFYTKASTFIHGVEGEDGKPCHGQLEIHNKITSMGFQDCKVFIHSVDAQSSAHGGITILVIGEMSNQNGPWRKFVQSFFLAEQPNGYFVLNDMFRFLKEESVESDDASESEGAAAASDVATTAAPVTEHTQTPPPFESQPATHAPEPTPSYESQPASATTSTSVAVTPAPAKEEAVTPNVSVPEPALTPAAPDSQTQANGIHDAEPESPATQTAIEQSPVVPTSQAATASSPASVAVTLPAAPAVSPPTPSPPQPQHQQPPPAAQNQPPAAPAVPPAPKTWANLAAANSKKWGSAVAQESRGTTEVPAAASTPPASGTQTPVNPHGPPAHKRPGQQQHAHQHQNSHQHPRGEHPAVLAAQNVNTAQCFVKGAAEPLSPQMLTAALTSRFGPIKDLEIVRSKACAFLEFTQLEAAKKAIITSLPQAQGGEGGIWIDVGGETGQMRISVETRKERGERPVSRPRGGGPVNGDSRGGGGGGYRGRGSTRGRGGGGLGAK